MSCEFREVTIVVSYIVVDIRYVRFGLQVEDLELSFDFVVLQVVDSRSF